VEDLFHAVRRLSSAEREARLVELSHGDEALRACVVALLHAEERASSFLAEPARDASVAQPGQRIGRYRLLELLGSGGRDPMAGHLRRWENVRRNGRPSTPAARCPRMKLLESALAFAFSLASAGSAQTPYVVDGSNAL